MSVGFGVNGIRVRTIQKMLVLSRKVGEKLVIDGNITVEVVRIQGNRITLGIVAPADVKILRGELNQKQARTETAELVVEDGLLVASTYLNAASYSSMSHHIGKADCRASLARGKLGTRTSTAVIR